jgi:hypothetical protein
VLLVTWLALVLLPSRPRVAVVAAALTRAPGLALIAVAAAVAAVAVWLHVQRPPGRRLLVAAGPRALLGGEARSR